MILTIIFLVSGVCLVILLGTKMVEVKHKKSIFPLNFISKSDHRIKEIAHKATHQYSEIKEKSEFVIKKQIPLHSKNLYYKTESLVKEKAEKYLGNIRNARILNKKSDGISEFFKSLSDKENGDSQNGGNEVK
jgi:hypothetical protein